MNGCRDMMDMREIRFFLAIAREKSFVRAAQVLNHTQPNLTRTIKALEEKLGGALFLRSTKGVTLTAKGEAFLRRAVEIAELVDITQQEVCLLEDDCDMCGDIRIAAGETIHMNKLVRYMQKTRCKYPGIHFHVHSANGEDVARRVDLGLADLGLVFEPFDVTPYIHRRLPWDEHWGIAVRADHELAQKQHIVAADLQNLPLIVSAQMWEKNAFDDWYGKDIDKLNIVATYNLIGTAKQMIEEDLGIVLTFAGLLRDSPHLKFIPLFPKLDASPYLIRKSNCRTAAHVQVFLDELQEMFTKG